MEQSHKGQRAVKKVTLQEESYWKLQEMKAKMKCGTWKELIDKLYDKIKNSV